MLAGVILVAGGVALAALLGVFDSGSAPQVVAVVATKTVPQPKRRATRPPTTTSPDTTTAATPPASTETTQPPSAVAATHLLVEVRTVSIASLHRPDAEDHCLGPTPRPGQPHITFELNGTFVENVAGKAARYPILICGKHGDPSYATGTYRFGGASLGTAARLGAFDTRFGIDESGGEDQPSASVKLAVVYYGVTVCRSIAASWQEPQQLHCDLSKVDRPADVSQLRIFQLVQGAAPPDVWAGLWSPRVTLLRPRP